MIERDVAEALHSQKRGKMGTWQRPFLLWNMLECHKVPRLPRETKLHDVWNLQKWPLLQNSPQARP